MFTHDILFSMLYSSRPQIADQIIDTLAEGTLDTLVLLEKLNKKHSVTKQGFYRALRTLLKDEVVTKNKQLVFLSPIWINKMKQFTERVGGGVHENDADRILNMEEGDSAVFKFKSITDLYFLWIHYFQLFAQRIEGPIVYYNSHNFWALVRSDIENSFYEWVKSNGKKTYCVIGHTTPLDRTTSTYLHTEYGIELAFENVSIDHHVYPTVFGDYVVSTVLDTNTAKAIDNVYKKYPKWEPVVEEELKEIISRMRRSKVVIERNKKKAELLRKKLMKYFVFYGSASLTTSK